MFYEIEQHIALLESYIDSPTPTAFIEQLNNPTEKIFLKLLTTPIDDIEDYRKQLNKLEVGQGLRNAILSYRLEHLVHSLKAVPDKKTLQEIKKYFAEYIAFNYEKPANIRREELVGQEETTNARIGVLSKEAEEYINKKVA